MNLPELFDEWLTYEKVVSHDYMHHQRFFSTLTKMAEARFGSPIDILDLGCGDARPIAPLIDALEVASYTGLDPAPAALEGARVQLEAIGVDFTLVPATMEDGIDSIEGPFDLIVASFALHHLSRDQKGKMLAACKTRLKPGGLIAVIDVFLEPGETRDEYLDRWEQATRSGWNALNNIEIKRLVDHVREHDFPETADTYDELAASAGLGPAATLWSGPERLNRIVVIPA